MKKMWAEENIFDPHKDDEAFLISADPGQVLDKISAAAMEVFIGVRQHLKALSFHAYKHGAMDGKSVIKRENLKSSFEELWPHLMGTIEQNLYVNWKEPYSEKVRKDEDGNVGFATLLAILFIGLKLGGIITWSWFWVLSPVWIGALIFLLCFGGLALYYFWGKSK